MATLIKIDRNGTKHYEGKVTCDRCGGLGGHDAWSFTGWKCYKCGGEGKVWGKWKEYTPEYEEKLRAKAEAKARAWEEAHREEIEAQKRKAEEEEKRRQEEAQKEAERKAKSNYIGEVGGKIETQAILESHIKYTAIPFCGFGEETRYIYKFRIGDDLATWFTTSGKFYQLEEGTKVTLTGTVKKHEEYKGEKQTVLTRCKVAA